VPLRSRSQYPKDAVDEQAVVLGGPAGIGLLAWPHLRDTRPLLVVELVSLRHALRSESMDPESNESEPIPDGNPECRLDLDQVSVAVIGHLDHSFEGTLRLFANALRRSEQRDVNTCETIGPARLEISAASRAVGCMRREIASAGRRKKLAPSCFVRFN